jgi:transposase
LETVIVKVLSMMQFREPYPSDVSDEEWAFVAPYLCFWPEGAGQRRHTLREVCNALRYLARSGASWRMWPNDFPPWVIVYQQTQRWMVAAAFEVKGVRSERVAARLGRAQGLACAAVILDNLPLCGNSISIP